MEDSCECDGKCAVKSSSGDKTTADNLTGRRIFPCNLALSISALFVKDCKKKRAGEYSEEDTHRPVHRFPKVTANRTFGRRREAPALEKETRWNK